MSNRTDPRNVVTTADRRPAANGGVKVVSNSHDVHVHADYAMWDPTTNAYVLPEDTNFGKAK